MKSIRVFTSLSPQMLNKIDVAATASFTTRSQFIRESIALRLNDQHIVSRHNQNQFVQQLNNLADEDEAEDEDYLFDL